jgi:hypothetical protein
LHKLEGLFVPLVLRLEVVDIGGHFFAESVDLASDVVSTRVHLFDVLELGLELLLDGLSSPLLDGFNFSSHHLGH